MLCQLWNHIVRRHLFRVVSLWFIEGKAQEHATARTLEKMSQWLHLRRDVASCIQNFTLRMQLYTASVITPGRMDEAPSPGWSSAHRSRVSLLQQVLSRLPNLRQVRMIDACVVLDDPDQIEYFPPMDLDPLLIAQYCRPDFVTDLNAILSLLGLFGDIKELEIGGIQVVTSPLEPLIPAHLRFNSLTFVGEEPSWPLLRILLDPHCFAGAQNLKQLLLGVQAGHWPHITALLSKVSSTLHELRLYFPAFSDDEGGET